jgi:hypothetical protein
MFFSTHCWVARFLFPHTDTSFIKRRCQLFNVNPPLFTLTTYSKAATAQYSCHSRHFYWKISFSSHFVNTHTNVSISVTFLLRVSHCGMDLHSVIIANVNTRYGSVNTWHQVHRNNKVKKKKKKNSMVWFRERTIPTVRPPLVGEVIANFCGYRVPRGQRDRSPLAVFSVF